MTENIKLEDTNHFGLEMMLHSDYWEGFGQEETDEQRLSRIWFGVIFLNTADRNRVLSMTPSLEDLVGLPRDMVKEIMLDRVKAGIL